MFLPKAPVWDKAPGNSDYSLPDNTTTAPGTPLGTFSLRDPDTCTCTITSPAAGTHPYVLNQITTVDPQGKYKLSRKKQHDSEPPTQIDSITTVVYNCAASREHQQCGFRTGRTSFELYKTRKCLEAGNVGFKKNTNCIIRAAKKMR